MSEAQKRKKSFYKGKYGGKKGRYDSELRSKMKGFILTCNGQERSAALEGYRILNEYGDKRYGPENQNEAASDSDGAEDIEAALKEEISSIKAKSKSKERRFQTVQNRAKNVLFVKATIDKPSDLAKDIFDDFRETGVTKAKYCCKLLPVEDTCYAKADQIIVMAKPLIQKFFTENEKPFSYCIMWKTRCNNTIKRDDVYPGLVEIIKEFEKDHTVSYDNPEVVINIDIIGNVCCFGFLWDYHKNGKYNLDTVTHKKKNQLDMDENADEESVVEGGKKDNGAKEEEEKEIKQEVKEVTDQQEDGEQKPGTVEIQEVPDTSEE